MGERDARDFRIPPIPYLPPLPNQVHAALLPYKTLSTSGGLLTKGEGYEHKEGIVALFALAGRGAGVWSRPGAVAPAHARRAGDEPPRAGTFQRSVRNEQRRHPDRGSSRLPNGADRFYNLVRAGYYDQVRFHRVIEGRWAQFGINGDPKVSSVWRARTIPDDPRRESNVRGTVAYAFAVANGRTTQVFINLRDNSATHDAEPFAPFGRVAEGMDVVDKLNAEYGESAGGGIRAGKQGPLFEGGADYLKRNFPRLDYIVRATVVER